ncbi:MAG TPA: protein kinase [Clostridiales bacterium]|nr:protein kinase [Clostridiales bacterium]
MKNTEKMADKNFGVKELLGGRYRLVKILGRGGMSTVFLAENINLGTFWAVKKISKNVDVTKELPVESNILKKLNHPALPRIIDIIENEDNIYIVQDFIEGTSLDKEIEKSGKFTETKVIEWAKQICDVLIYLHSFKPNPIIYRDMKPSNIILTPWGDIKLVDFGIAREYKEDVKNDTVYIGTRGYAAPEQYGRGQSNVTTDIYNFGVTLFHLLTGEEPGRFPFGLKLPECYNGNVSHRMMQIIYKCTRYNSEERYQSAHELKKDIEGWEKTSNVIDIVITDDTLHIGKLILTIWGNTEFACELAYIASKMTQLNILLVDLDLLSPSVDLFLNIKKHSEGLVGEGILNESGINIVLNSIEKGYFTREDLLRACIKRKDLKNLYILTGNYRLENYEYYNNEGLIKLIEKSSQIFDILILAVNKSIYDSFTILCLIKSDLNIIPIRADIDKFREFNNYIAFLKEKQQIPMDKTKFVAFDYCPSWNLDKGTIEEIVQHNYLGKVGYCPRRAKYRNLKIPYARKMDQDIIKDYISIIQKLKILHEGTYNKNRGVINTICRKIYKSFSKQRKAKVLRR